MATFFGIAYRILIMIAFPLVLYPVPTGQTAYANPFAYEGIACFLFGLAFAVLYFQDYDISTMFNKRE